MSVFGKGLDGTEVVRDDGVSLGFYRDLEFDAQTGKAKHILVEPGEQTPTAKINFERTDTGKYRVPVSNVAAARERIVIER